MKEVIEKAAVLIESLPYIQNFRGETVVVKFGGSAMEDPELFDSILQDMVFMECIGIRPVIVHGGGKAISRGMKASGLPTRFVKGLRITCEKTMDVVAHVFRKEVNPRIVETLERIGAQAKGVPGEDVFRVARLVQPDPETGHMLDWGYVGEPQSALSAPVIELTLQHIIPVVTPLGRDAEGKIHNMNADTAAAALAKALQARKLVYLTNVPGLLRDKDDPNSILTALKAADVESLIERHVIDGGMLPKIQSGVDALHAGVKKVHMIDGNLPHSLLLEIFTDHGIGTEIVAD